MGAVDKVVGLKTLRHQLHQSEQDLARARSTIATLQAQCRELAKENELLRADADRYRKLVEAHAPHQPERVAPEAMQLAFAEVLQTIGSDVLAANDTPPASDAAATPPAGTPPRRQGKRDRHGRRPLDLTKLPVQTVKVTPEEVRAVDGVGFERVGDETAERLAYRPGAFVCLRVIREKYKRVAVASLAGTETTGEQLAHDEAVETSISGPDAEILTAKIPASLWPNVMADTSAIAHHIVSKYDDLLPLHRLQMISARHGFEIPRSTQAGWLGQAFFWVQPLVRAMFAEAERKARYIATDATGVRVRIAGQRACANWHVFVLLADHDHILFKYSEKHDAATARAMVGHFKGYLHVDAAGIYDGLFDEPGLIEVACWAHLRRYVWKSLASEPKRATEWLAIIARLYAAHHETLALPMPLRTYERARLAAPILELMEAWLDRETPTIDPRTPLRAAITYYENQRLALHRFMENGSLPLDNNRAEGSLRRLVLGQMNWVRFQNETGVKWFCAFRSLIASCHLHALNPQIYLEQVLRLLPHWPRARTLDISPRYWRQTVTTLTEAQREIITPSWGSAATHDAAVLQRPLVTLAR